MQISGVCVDLPRRKEEGASDSDLVAAGRERHPFLLFMHEQSFGKVRAHCLDDAAVAQDMLRGLGAEEREEKVEVGRVSSALQDFQGLRKEKEEECGRKREKILLLAELRIPTNFLSSLKLKKWPILNSLSTM